MIPGCYASAWHGCTPCAQTTYPTYKMTTRRKGMYLLALHQLWPSLQRGRLIPGPGLERLCQSFRWVQLARGRISRLCTAPPRTEEGRGAAGRAQPRWCPRSAAWPRGDPRRPPATPAPCAAAAAPPGTAARARCGTTRGRHGSRASPSLPSPISVPLPPRFWLLFFFPTFFVFHQPPLTPASRGALWGTPGHRRPPRPASASGHLHKAHPSPQPPVSPPRAEPTPPAHPAARPRCSLGAGASPRRGGRRAPARGGPRQRPPSGTPRREASAGAAPPRAR